MGKSWALVTRSFDSGKDFAVTSAPTEPAAWRLMLFENGSHSDAAAVCERRKSTIQISLIPHEGGGEGAIQTPRSGFAKAGCYKRKDTRAYFSITKTSA